MAVAGVVFDDAALAGAAFFGFRFLIAGAFFLILFFAGAASAGGVLFANFSLEKMEFG